MIERITDDRVVDQMWDSLQRYAESSFERAEQQRLREDHIAARAEAARLRERYDTADKQWRVEADHRRAVEGECDMLRATLAKIRRDQK